MIFGSKSLFKLTMDTMGEFTGVYNVVSDSFSVLQIMGSTL